MTLVAAKHDRELKTEGKQARWDMNIRIGDGKQQQGPTNKGAANFAPAATNAPHNGGEAANYAPAAISAPTKTVEAVAEAPAPGGAPQPAPGAANDAPAAESAPQSTFEDITLGEGLTPPTLDSGEAVTGMSKKRHRIENKRKRIKKQSAQGEVNYWTTHKGDFVIPPAKPSLTEYRGSMCPQGLALEHPAAAQLLTYATRGCPTNTGKPWTFDQMEEAIERGPHVSALNEVAMKILQDEVKMKAKQGQCRVVLWEDIKHNPPKELKVSPIAMIPHKSRLFWAILDISFSLRLKNGQILPSVNET
jgi:hypothetical protein